MSSAEGMIEQSNRDNTAAFAEAFFIGNLLFVGVFYLALWMLYFNKYKAASMVTQHHLKQALVCSSISTALFVLINVFIIMTSGYASVTALFLLELYFMLILPVFLVAGIVGFSRAIKGEGFSCPLIGKWLVNENFNENLKEQLNQDVSS